MTSRAVTLAGFALIGALLLAWAVYTQRRRDSLNVARALAAVTRTRTGKVAMFLFWAWLGVHLFARGTVGNN